MKFGTINYARIAAEKKRIMTAFRVSYITNSLFLLEELKNLCFHLSLH